MAAVLHSASLPLVDGFIHVRHVVKCDHVIVWPSVGVQTKDDPRKVEQQLKKCSSLFFLLFLFTVSTSSRRRPEREHLLLYRHPTLSASET